MNKAVKLRNVEKYIQHLEEEFRQSSNPETAQGQEAYMRNQFAFLGIKTTERREMQKLFLKKENLPPKKGLKEIVRLLWEKPEREYQYFAQELLFRHKKDLQQEDLALLEYMITSKSWWDTVDFIAAKLVGAYFLKFPEKREESVMKWLSSGDIWLQRTAVLFQLKYKEQTDTDLLASTIRSLLGNRDFFINKGIGWALREYSKTDPKWVMEFVESTELSSLSRKEGLRLV